MGILSTLMKVAGIAAAPFTGGSSLVAAGAPDMLGGLSDVFGGAAKSDVAQSNNAGALKLALARLGLDTKKFATTAPAARLATGQRAALANAASPAEVHWGGPGSGLRGEVPTYTGGIKSIYKANQDPEMRQLSQQTLHDSLVAQMKGGADPNGLGVPGSDMDMGSAAHVGEGSTGGDILGGLSLGTSIASILKRAGVFGGGGNGDSIDV